MRSYRFDIHQEYITRLEVMADSPQEAHDRALHQDEHVTALDTQYGDIRLVLRSDEDD